MIRVNLVYIIKKLAGPGVDTLRKFNVHRREDGEAEG